jgi:small subunit ribosomal protein S21
LRVEVRGGNLEKALRILKKKLQKDGRLKELRDRQYFSKPSEIKREAAKQRLKNIKKAESLKKKMM